MLIRSQLKNLVVSRAFENKLFSLGARNYYARTTPDFFEIGLTFPQDSLEQILMLEGDFLIEPVFRDFFEERFLILQKANSLENSPNSENYEKLLEKAFGEDVSVLNKKSSNVRNITLAKFKDYFKKALNPKYAVVVISGNCGFDKALNLVKKYLGRIVSDTKEPLKLNDHVINESSCTVFSQKALLLGLVKTRVVPEEEAAIDIISNYLTIGKNPLLSTKISEKIVSGNVLNGYPGLYPPNLFLFNLILKENGVSEDVTQKTKDLFRNLCYNPLDENLLEESRRKLLFLIYSNSEKSENLVRQIGEGYLLTKNSQYFFDYITSVKQMTPEKIKQNLKSLFFEERAIK